MTKVSSDEYFRELVAEHIEEYARAHGSWPTYPALADTFDVSKHQIMVTVDKLVGQGRLTRPLAPEKPKAPIANVSSVSVCSACGANHFVASCPVCADPVRYGRDAVQA